MKRAHKINEPVDYHDEGQVLLELGPATGQDEVDAQDARAAIAQLPSFSADRTEVHALREVEIP
jgi:hypothetical protein